VARTLTLAHLRAHHPLATVPAAEIAVLESLDLHNLQDIHPVLQIAQPLPPFPELPLLKAWACLIPGCSVVQTSRKRVLDHSWQDHGMVRMQDWKESLVPCSAQALNRHSYLF
jgi:hypothetical protein